MMSKLLHLMNYITGNFLSLSIPSGTDDISLKTAIHENWNTPHCALPVRVRLENQFLFTWIGRGGPTE